MSNQYNGGSVLNYFQLNTLDIGGDPCHVEIVLSYDFDSNFYTVERFNNRKSWHHEEFDTQFSASVCFNTWVNRATKDDAENRAESSASLGVSRYRFKS